jgi:hypothetical protein
MPEIFVTYEPDLFLMDEKTANGTTRDLCSSSFQPSLSRIVRAVVRSDSSHILKSVLQSRPSSLLILIGDGTGIESGKRKEIVISSTCESDRFSSRRENPSHRLNWASFSDRRSRFLGFANINQA